MRIFLKGLGLICIMNAVGSPLTVHLPHGTHIVVGVFEADKAVALGLSGAFVSYHFSLQERWIATECSGQDVVVHLVTQVSTEYPKVV